MDSGGSDVRIAGAEDQLGVYAATAGGIYQSYDLGCGEQHVERFGQAGVSKEKISMVKDTYYFASPETSPTQFIELFETFYGPTMNAVEAAAKNGKAGELHAQVVDLANSQNQSKEAGTLIPATFMRVTVSV